MFKTCVTLAVLACLTLEASTLHNNKYRPMQVYQRKNYISSNWTGAATNIQDSWTNITDGGEYNAFIGGSVVGSGNSSTEIIVTGSNNTLGAITVTN